MKQVANRPVTGSEAHCLTSIVLYTDVGAYCDKRPWSSIERRPSQVLSTYRRRLLVYHTKRPRMSREHCGDRCVRRWHAVAKVVYVQNLGQSSAGKYPWYFRTIQYSNSRKKPLRQKPARSVQLFSQNSDLCQTQKTQLLGQLAVTTVGQCKTMRVSV